ncbi:transposase InsO family protein [Enterococcus rivorum]|nr:transposase InsO family protein [Enterococcus rivorum]
MPSTRYFPPSLLLSPSKKKSESELEALVEEVFLQSRKNYGTRKIKMELKKRGLCVSRRKIGQVKKRRGLLSNYTKAHFKKITSAVNEALVDNKLQRSFSNRASLEAIVTDLTYVRVGHHWHYICLILDLSNREISGYSCGRHKDTALVKQAFSRLLYSLLDVKIFHTDRGKEFDNQLITALVDSFQIERSLSQKGSPYDNAVAESTYKSLKVEFV